MWAYLLRTAFSLLSGIQTSMAWRLRATGATSSNPYPEWYSSMGVWMGEERERERETET